MNAPGVPEGAVCEALTRSGWRCQYLARTRHYLEGNAGPVILLCNHHDRMLDERARHEQGKGETDLLAEWGRAQPEPL